MSGTNISLPDRTRGARIPVPTLRGRFHVGPPISDSFGRSSRDIIYPQGVKDGCSNTKYGLTDQLRLRIDEAVIDSARSGNLSLADLMLAENELTRLANGLLAHCSLDSFANQERLAVWTRHYSVDTDLYARTHPDTSQADVSQQADAKHEVKEYDFANVPDRDLTKILRPKSQINETFSLSALPAQRFYSHLDSLSDRWQPLGIEEDSGPSVPVVVSVVRDGEHFVVNIPISATCTRNDEHGEISAKSLDQICEDMTTRTLSLLQHIVDGSEKGLTALLNQDEEARDSLDGSVWREYREAFVLAEKLDVEPVYYDTLCPTLAGHIEKIAQLKDGTSVIIKYYLLHAGSTRESWTME